jgi:hypothetical protein
MKLTPDERAFIARWLLEFGEEPVSLSRRLESDWLKPAGAYRGMSRLWSSLDNGKGGQIRPVALEAFKGDDHE